MNALRIGRWVSLLLVLALTFGTGATVLAESPAEGLYPSQAASAISPTTLLNSAVILVVMPVVLSIAGVHFVRGMNRMFDEICDGDGLGRTLASMDPPIPPPS